MNFDVFCRLIFWFWSISFDCCCGLVCFLGGAGDRAGFVNASSLGLIFSGFDLELIVFCCDNTVWSVFCPDCWVARSSGGILTLRQRESNLGCDACNDFSKAL